MAVRSARCPDAAKGATASGSGCSYPLDAIFAGANTSRRPSAGNVSFVTHLALPERFSRSCSIRPSPSSVDSNRFTEVRGRLCESAPVRRAAVTHQDHEKVTIPRFPTQVGGIAIALLAAAGSRSAAAVTSVLPCRNAPDTAAAILATLGGQLANHDSTKRVVLGIRVASGSAALGTDSLV